MAIDTDSLIAKLKPDTFPSEKRVYKDFNAYFNSQFDEKPLYIKPGQSLCSKGEDEMIIAHVGSGVLASLYDPEAKLGALSYILLCEQLIDAFPHFDKADNAAIERALEPLNEALAEVRKAGSPEHKLHVRLIGGTAMPGDALDCGTKSAVFAREFLTRKGLAILNEDLGGPYVRRVHFFPATGHAVRLILRRSSDFAAMFRDEQEYRTRA